MYHKIFFQSSIKCHQVCFQIMLFTVCHFVVCRNGVHFKKNLVSKLTVSANTIINRVDIKIKNDIQLNKHIILKVR